MQVASKTSGLGVVPDEGCLHQNSIVFPLQLLNPEAVKYTHPFGEIEDGSMSKLRVPVHGNMLTEQLIVESGDVQLGSELLVLP